MPLPDIFDKGVFIFIVNEYDSLFKSIMLSIWRPVANILFLLSGSLARVIFNTAGTVLYFITGIIYYLKVS